MSIQAPEYNSSLRYNYGGSAVPNDYSGGGYGSNPALQAYQKKLNDWYKNASQIFKSLKNGEQKNIVAQELQQAQEYAQECGFQLGSDWDPMTGNLGTDPSNPLGDPTQETPQQAQYGEMIWQDASRVKWDGSDPVVYQVSQQGEKRQQDFFQSDVTIQIPYHGAIAKAELVKDDSAAAPAQMLKVTVTMPDGSTRIICVHNVTAKSQIKLQASDTDNIKLDASLTSSTLAAQVEVGEISNEEENVDNEPKGDPAKERKDKKWGWDGDSFDIYSTNDPKDKHKDKYISARKNVTFHASSNSEFWTVEWDDTKKEYVVKVYDDAEHKNLNETFHMDDMTNLKATFDIDPTHIEFLNSLGDSKDVHKINTTDPHAKKLAFDQSAEDPDKVDENNLLGEEASKITKDKTLLEGDYTKGTFDKKPDPNFKNNWEFEGNTYIAEVSASGTVTITSGSQMEDCTVTLLGNRLIVQYTIKDKDGKNKTIKYDMDADQISKLVLSGISPAKLKGLDKIPEKYRNKIMGSDGKPIATSQQASGQSPDNANISQDLKNAASIDNVKKNLNLSFHKDGPGNQTNGEDGFYANACQFVSDAMNGIAEGMNSNPPNWTKLKEAIDFIKSKIGADQWSSNRMANAFDALFMTLYNTLGKSKMKTVLTKLSKDDPELFDKVRNGFAKDDGALNPYHAYDSDGEGEGAEAPDTTEYWSKGPWGQDPAFKAGGEFSKHSQVKSWLDDIAAGK